MEQAQIEGRHFDYIIMDDLVPPPIKIVPGEVYCYGTVMCGFGPRPLAHYKETDPDLLYREEIVVYSSRCQL